MSTADLEVFLAGSALFAELTPRDRATVARHLRPRTIEHGAFLFREGDPGDSLFIVQRGRFEVLKRRDDGRDVWLRTLQARELGGLTSMSVVKQRSASLRALGDAVALTIPRDDFLELVQTVPGLATALLAHLSAKIRANTDRLAGLLPAGGAPRRTRVALFDAKPYEVDRFAALAGEDLAFQFFEMSLGVDTAPLAAGFRVVCAFVNDDLSAPVIDALAASGVELIALRCAGYNNVDVQRAVERGLSVVRVPAYSPYAVAEHALALLLTLNRKTHRAHARVREGNFSLQGLVGFDLHGRTAGLIGLGQIGRALARILVGCGMRVLASDPGVSPAEAAALGVEWVELDPLLEQADVISLHAPLVPETHHLIDAARIARMKPGVVLINTSRGGLIDTAALIGGLKSGHIGAAGLDVYEEESGYFFHDRSETIIADDVLARLMTFNNVLITSHQGFLTDEALGNIAATTAASIRAFIGGQRGVALSHAVGPPPAAAG